jgi:hypothetical protein
MMAKHEIVEPVYLEMTEPHGDARYGKLAKGRVVAVDPTRAERWLASGIAKESSKSAYEKSRDNRVTVGDTRAAAFQSQDMSDAHLWDINYRDAMTADPNKLQEAMDAGIPVLNTGNLVTEDGVPLRGDASFEDIMEARDRMQHPDDDESYSHTQSSVSGNRSHYQDFPATQLAEEDAPPKRRTGRLARAQVGNAPEDDKPRSGGTTTGDTLGHVTTKKD